MILSVKGMHLFFIFLLTWHGAEWKETFDAFDRNKNGVICLNELETIMQMLGNNPTPEEIKQIMAEIDKNRKYF